MDHARFLKKVSIFSGLSPADLRTVAALARPVEVARGDTLFSKSSSGDALYVVLKGTVKIVSRSRSGQSKTFAFLQAPDVFGEVALLAGGGRSAAVVAMTAATLLRIRRAEFQPLLTKRPQLCLAVLRSLCERLRQADEEIESLSFNTVLGRTARILLDLAKRYGEKVPAGGTRIALAVSQKDIADRAGTAREMISRVIGRLERTGCLEMDGASLVLKDVEKLRQWIY